VIHDLNLLGQLEALEKQPFDGEVFRATRLNLDPLAASTSGGRWAPRDRVAVLYTSLRREGALAEISYHWAQLTPLPSKPVIVHQLKVSADRTLRLLRGRLEDLGVDMERYPGRSYQRTQEIGAAVAFLGCDGLLVPCARWDCENLVLFTENHALTNTLEVILSEEVNWQNWARDAGLIELDNVL